MWNAPGPSPEDVPGGGPSRSPLARLDALIAAALALGLLVAQRGVVALWWLDDDLFNLRWVESQPVLGQLVDPTLWQQLPFRMLTPALFLSMEADLALFGPDPRAWHLHQLVAQAIAAAVFYLVLRLWTGRWPALAATLCGFGSPSVAALAAAIPVRHYVEGAILALVAIAGWTRALRAASRAAATGWALVAGLAYLGAALAKEVFVPLPLLLAALPVGGRAARLRALAPQGVALACYAVYRRAMLGTWGGGYGWAVSPADYPGLLVALPAKLAAAASGPAAAVAAALLAAQLLMVALGLGRRKAELTALAVGGIALLGPLLPVSTEVPSRYAAVPVLALAAAAAVALERAMRRWPGPGRGLAAAVTALAGLTLAVAWPPILATAERQSRENRAFLDLDGGDALRSPSAPPGTMEELARLVAPPGVAAPSGPGGADAPAWFYDDLFLCRRADGETLRVWEYDATSRAVLALPTGRVAELRDGCSRTEAGLPLAASFRWRSGILRWTLGPPGEGRFRLVVAAGRAVLETPAEGAFHVGDRGSLRLAVRRTAADGRTTVSPELELTPESEVTWRSGLLETSGGSGR